MPRSARSAAGWPASGRKASARRRVYEELQCAGCHGTDGRGAGAVLTVFEDDWQHPLHAADLTAPWTFHI